MCNVKYQKTIIFRVGVNSREVMKRVAKTASGKKLRNCLTYNSQPKFVVFKFAPLCDLPKTHMCIHKQTKKKKHKKHEHTHNRLAHRHKSTRCCNLSYCLLWPSYSQTYVSLNVADVFYTFYLLWIKILQFKVFTTCNAILLI